MYRPDMQNQLLRDLYCLDKTRQSWVERPKAKSSPSEIRPQPHVSTTTKHILGADPGATKGVLFWSDFIGVEEVRWRLEN